MPIEKCRQIILLLRLRHKARRLADANRRAGNGAIAGIYRRIDDWLESQMGHALVDGEY